MKKPKILLVVDKPNWAYDQMANYIIKELSYKYDFFKDYQILPPKNWKSYLNYKLFNIKRYLKRRVSTQKYDLTVFLWWKSKQLFPGIKSSKVLVGLFTEGFPPGNNQELAGITIENFISEYIMPSDGIVAGNRNIFNFYKEKGVPVYYATGATNTEQFTPNRAYRNDNELRV